MATDVGMTGDQYLTGLTLYFIGYVLFEVPANTVLKLGTPKIWLPTVSLVWGVVATLLGVVQNYPGYLSSRFFLGVAESGLFPGVVYYLSMWYKRNEQHYRVALFFSAASLAGAFGGVLAWVGRGFSCMADRLLNLLSGYRTYEGSWRFKWMALDLHPGKTLKIRPSMGNMLIWLVLIRKVS